MAIDNTITIKPNQVIEIEYFNSNIDGLNNLTIKINENSIKVYSFDDSCNEYLIKTITLDYLLEIASKAINKKIKSI